jgi:hypothetical protein
MDSSLRDTKNLEVFWSQTVLAGNISSLRKKLWILGLLTNIKYSVYSLQFVKERNFQYFSISPIKYA